MAQGLTVGGWIFLLSSWGIIIGVTIWCVAKLVAGNNTTKEDG
jgi:hypothetical protein